MSNGIGSETHGTSPETLHLTYEVTPNIAFWKVPRKKLRARFLIEIQFLEPKFKEKIQHQGRNSPHLKKNWKKRRNMFGHVSKNMASFRKVDRFYFIRW